MHSGLEYVVCSMYSARHTGRCDYAERTRPARELVPETASEG
jgi:hypothetical protein